MALVVVSVGSVTISDTEDTPDPVTSFALMDTDPPNECDLKETGSLSC